MKGGPAANIIEENTGHVDYAIKNYQRDVGGNNLHNKQNQATVDHGLLLTRLTISLQMNISKNRKSIGVRSDYNYVYGIIKDAIKDIEFRKNVKRVLEVIVGLLKDRVVGSEEPAT
ncbi:12960_t:CDS:2 [Funneliformis caledonium]|uniref:12960_t:CDS:1 n=1 Tax=Funneliformis caledonium TaxID=1117310 RepID=A0A9N8V976_9GLOM|nr:12960_t:CDS:2 [Funneliformis caledonium]